MHIEEHFRKTERLLRAIPVAEVAKWLLNEGYFPERYILPPSFHVSNFELQNQPYNSDLSDLTRRHIETISYPKTLLTSRAFGVIHPWNYHDIVYYLSENWQDVLDHLFHADQRIFSYSNPIPVNNQRNGRIGFLRAGRMIYEWLAMAEEDLILDAGEYKYLVRTDIANFYASIYTHTIPWALHGRENALQDRERNLLGSKLDRLLHYANDARTNGIPVGSALSDLISEILLSAVDCKVSRRCLGIPFAATRFKDDYRLLCQTKEEGQRFLKHLADVLGEYNLVLNENKTTMLELPDGLYRKHDRAYFPHSLKGMPFITFKEFEHTLMIALNIHRNYPGTSIMEKYISELFSWNKTLKVQFSAISTKRLHQIKKMIQLLFFAKRESQKLLCHVLSVCELLYLKYRQEYPMLKKYLKNIIEYELKNAANNGSAFEVVWYMFFSRYISLGIVGFDSIVVNPSVMDNGFYKSMVTSQNKLFNEVNVDLFRKPKDCRYRRLVRHTNVFE